MKSLRPLLTALSLLPLLAQAQSAWRHEAVPFVPPAVFARMQSVHWYQPRASEWQRANTALAAAVAADCAQGGAWQRARPAWLSSLEAWDALSTVAVGPLVSRRSARRVDFQPTRPDSIQRVLAQAAAGPLQTELLGSAVRGLPALEWLLWSKEAPRADAAACRYAQTLVQDLQEEAAAQVSGFAERADALADEPEDAVVVEQMGEALNQWLGGIDALRMQAVERPLHSPRTATQTLALPRGLSGASALDRGTRWHALRTLLVFDGAVAPALGQALVPIETVLRGQGRNPLAEQVRREVLAVDRALAAVRERQPTTLARLSATLATLRTTVESQVAPALNISIGFSDADGD